MSPEDVFLWPDGFWCYRKDMHEIPPRPDSLQYRIVPMWTMQWFQYAPPSANGSAPQRSHDARGEPSQGSQ